MSTPPTSPAGPPASLTLPLTQEQRAAYQDLYNKYETAIENTNDPDLEAALLASQSGVESILNNDAMYQLNANTAFFDPLLKQINSTNGDLKTLKAQILAISSGISTFSDILAAITRVLTVMPGA